MLCKHGPLYLSEAPFIDRNDTQLITHLHIFLRAFAYKTVFMSDLIVLVCVCVCLPSHLAEAPLNRP